MLVNDELYFQTFRKLLEAVVEAGGLEVSVEHLRQNHFHRLSRKINSKSGLSYGIRPTTFRDYRYIYKGEKKFSVRQNRLDLLCDFLGFNGWVDYRRTYFQNTKIKVNGEPKVRLLVLPDKRIGAVKRFEGQIAELIVSRYEDLKHDLAIDHLEIMYQGHLNTAPTGINKIRDLGISNQADIVIWPEYIHGKSPMMRVRSLLIDVGKEMMKSQIQPFQKADKLAYIHEGAFLEETDKQLFFLLGHNALKKGEMVSAKCYFERVLKLDPDHAEAKHYLNAITSDTPDTEQETEANATVKDTIATIPISMSKILASHDEKQFATLDSFEEKGKLIPQGIGDKTISLQDHLLILKGDNRVLKTKDLEPLVRNMFVHEDELVIFLTSQTDVALMSMKDLNIFCLQAKRKETTLKEALVVLNPQESRKKQETISDFHSMKWLVIQPSNQYHDKNSLSQSTEIPNQSIFHPLE